MHLLVTDVLTCPRCGPRFGLILLADRIEARRVLEGRLGCANCREQYPIRGGYAELRLPPTSALPSPPPTGEAAGPVEEEDAVRLAALLGVSGGRGNYLIVGPGARLAPAIAALVPDAEILAADPELAGLPEQPGVTRLASGPQLPFSDRSLRAVALTGEGVSLEEALRVLAPAGRIVLDPAPPQTAERLRAAGLQILLDQEGVVVASPPVTR